MFGAEMAVGSGNEHAAVGMPKPFSDHLEVDAVLDGVAGEEMTEGVVVIVRQAQPTTGGLNGLFRGLDGEDGIGGAEWSRQLALRFNNSRSSGGNNGTVRVLPPSEPFPVTVNVCRSKSISPHVIGSLSNLRSPTASARRQPL